MKEYIDVLLGDSEDGYEEIERIVRELRRVEHDIDDIDRFMQFPEFTLELTNVAAEFRVHVPAELTMDVLERAKTDHEKRRKALTDALRERVQ